MKTSINIIIYVLLLACLSSCVTERIYSVNYKKDKYERAGYRGKSYLKVNNKSDQIATITVSELNDQMDIISSKEYQIPAKSKVEIPLTRGMKRISDTIDYCVRDITPGTKYSIKIKEVAGLQSWDWGTN